MYHNTEKKRGVTVLSIKRICHLSRGTQLWLNTVEQLKSFFEGQRWLVKEFAKFNVSKYQLSKIYQENNKYFIACRDGKIYLDLKFSFKDFVLSIVK